MKIEGKMAVRERDEAAVRRRGASVHAPWSFAHGVRVDGGVVRC